ncbi:MAG: 4-carboxy-4-hydroxy-2-oxoadipate aldolase/oxaloacetate decarboxylase, partial [Chloroflexota bacterium]|nr:4-carboxy-4-hydroxy-2-oxoadipate aldolase/oxaloacetate decarboxylase [Chloroflexota bacterium]
MQPCVVRSIKRPDKRLAAALAEFGVATVHEAYKQQGLMRPDVRPVVPGKRICGPAVTCLCHPGDNIMLHAAIDVAQPGDAIVVATKAPSTDGMIGELIATQCQARGIVAVILDAGARDAADLRAMGFPVWSRAVSAAGTNKVNAGWVNVTVVCGGVTVKPGDLVVADDDGVVVVAAEDAEVVARASQARVDKEATARQRYQRGEVSLDVSGLRPVLDQLGVRYYDTLE